MSQKVSFSITIPFELAAWIKKKAEDEGKPVSRLITEILMPHFKRDSINYDY